MQPQKATNIHRCTFTANEDSETKCEIISDDWLVMANGISWDRKERIAVVDSGDRKIKFFEYKNSKIKFLRDFLLFIVLAVALLCIRTILIVPKAIDATDCKPSDFDYIPVDNGPLQRFRTAISFPTVSRSYTKLNENALKDLQTFIKTSKNIFRL